MIKAILALITALPEVLKLIKHLQDTHKKNQVNKKIKDDLNAINKAFTTMDAELLNRVFNGVSESRREDEDRRTDKN
jgi:hypothetical protein